MNEAGGPVNASTDAQLKYLHAVLKAKAHQIEELQLQVETGRLNSELQNVKLDRQLKVLEEVTKTVRERRDSAAPIRLTVGILQWIEYKNLPWWKRIFRKNPAKGVVNGPE